MDDPVGRHLQQQHPERPDRREAARSAAGLAGRACRSTSIRRPAQNSNENVTAPLVYQQRYFSIRRPAHPAVGHGRGHHEPADGRGGDAARGSRTSARQPVRRRRAAADAARRSRRSSGEPAADESARFRRTSTRAGASAPLIGGFIKIEMQQQDRRHWHGRRPPEILGPRASRGREPGDAIRTCDPGLANGWNCCRALHCPEINPNAVIRLQRVRDVPFNATTANTASA